MEPMTDFIQQLLPFKPKEEINTLSCNHIVDQNALVTLTIAAGPGDLTMDFSHRNRENEEMVWLKQKCWQGLN